MCFENPTSYNLNNLRKRRDLFNNIKYVKNKGGNTEGNYVF